MKTSQELLTSVLRTTQMGQSGIRSVLPKAIAPGLRRELEAQLAEYDAIETQAQKIAQRRGWKLSELSSAVQAMSTTMARAQLLGGNVDSKIAGMMIQGNTRGMITGLKNLHRSSHSDSSVEELAQRLLERETVNIQKTQPYL